MNILNKQRLANRVIEIGVENILPNPFQPRKVFNQSSLEDLARSIASQGLIQPIIVRKSSNNKYMLVSGERRLIALKMLKEEFARCIVQEYSEEQSVVVALIENIQRENLNFFEESEAIHLLISEFGYKQDYLSCILGKKQSTISNKLRLLRHSPSIRKMILENNLTERHARALLCLQTDQEKKEVIEYIVKFELSVAKTEKYLQERLDVKKKPHPKTTYIIKDYRIFINSFNNAVNVMKNSGIEASSFCEENEDSVTYTVTIPKKSIYRSTKRQQTAAS